ncbi:hypothetical protein CLV86_1512 [Lacinutrix venerupis]|uniref:hypothetical protein n=1 Tax=Lacinutrix venerupis TaxID=1486034 RepID=UPI000EAC960D|nr:hypothetical protein [Lacinutrix venerupis]RLJ64394.1 hypothetical protein CLV86_1512 [Lacinutrix venerupis]
MLEYLKFLFRKVKSLDRKLNNIAFLQDKTWIRISPNGFDEKWFFRKNRVLTLSINGNIVDGSYEFLNEYLIIEFSNKKILLNQSFIFNDILLLKKDSDDSTFFAFYDNSKFSKNEFLIYIENSRKKDLNIKQITLIDNTKAEIIRKPNQKGIIKGNTVLIGGEISKKKLIETKYYYYELINGKISNIFIKKKYKIYDNEIIIKQKWKEISIGDTIVSSNKEVINGRYKIKYIIGIEILDNTIEKRFHISYRKTLIKKRKIEVWQKTSYGYSVGDLVRKNNKKANNGKYWIEIFKILRVKNGKVA